MRLIRTLWAVVSGNAVVVTKEEGNRADVVVGRRLTRKFVLESFVGACKALML